MFNKFTVCKDSGRINKCALLYDIDKPGANGRNIVGQPTTPNIVGCYMLRQFAHPVACCYVLLGVVAQSLKPVKLLATFKRTQHLPAPLRVVASHGLHIAMKSVKNLVNSWTKRVCHRFLPIDRHNRYQSNPIYFIFNDLSIDNSGYTSADDSLLSGVMWVEKKKIIVEGKEWERGNY